MAAIAVAAMTKKDQFVVRLKGRDPDLAEGSFC
jgi:hypothetical protein